LAPVARGPIRVDTGTRRLTIPIDDGAAALVDAVGRLTEARITLHDIGLRRPTLDDVFLTLTGHEADESEPESEASPPAGMQEVLR
jgi:ABC-2 type transport system ATP-binding protein